MLPTESNRAVARFGHSLLAVALLATATPHRVSAAYGQLGLGLGRGNQPGGDSLIAQLHYGGEPPASASRLPGANLGTSKAPLRVMSTFFVTTTADTGGGSLRAAITAANASPGLDQIHFLILPGNAQTIAPAAPLPEITDPAIIDGTTQPGFSGTPLIELTGASAGPNAIGLVVKGGNSTIRGLVINRWATTGSGGYGIVLDVGSNNTVEGNYIGIDPTGVIPRPNAVNGVAIFGASTGNTIGGFTPQTRNVISGNASSGIQVGTGNAGGNVIRGNYIGVNAFGTSGLQNGGNGVFLNSPGNTIGGTQQGAGNVISGNALPGIFIGLAAPGTVVQGNLIGTDATGMSDVGNGQNGINIDRAADNIIGDSTGVARNVISGNQFPAVYVFGSAATGNRIQGNFLCVDRAGSGALGDGNGVVIDGASGTRVGGTTAAARNVIGGTPNVGVAVINGATANWIIGNYIGTDSSGTAPLGNLKGVLINNSAGNYVGGLSAGEGNVVAGNTQFGIELRNPGATANRVFGNKVGTSVNGTTNMGNGWHGVVLAGGASNDSILGNVVAYNKGVGVYDSSGTGNVISRNSIFENVARGIDLFPAGLSPNDSLDADVGANDLQNYPVLDSASVSDGVTRVYGRFNGRPGRSYVIEFFSSEAVDPSHFGEGQTYLDADVVLTDAAGNADIAVALPVEVSLARFLTATATDAVSGTTSEFSQGLCLRDTDGDGIWDCWETEGWGIDVNSDGVVDLDLYARGARPGHKDIFVEVDAMTGHGPQDSVLLLVEEAFAAVPNALLQNPDVQNGIALHCRPVDESNLASQNLPAMWGDFDTVKKKHFGTLAERSSPNRYYILQAKRLVYRYGLWGRTFCTGEDTLAGGVAELSGGLGGDDFLISLGSQGVCGWRDTADVRLRAGAFMHELGHTLGLGHGGADWLQFKPNYFSVMNYTWAAPQPKWQAPNSWRLDFSRAQFSTLNETALDEYTGLGVPSGFTPIVTVPYNDASKRLRQARLESGAGVDWSGDGIITAATVVADINIPKYGRQGCDGTVNTTVTPGEILRGQTDWSNLKYNFRNSPAWNVVGTRCSPPSTALTLGTLLDDPPLEEPTREILEALSNLPAPRPEGRFVMDGVLDSTARLLDSNAGISLYAAYASGQLYLATGAAPAQGGDLVVFVTDTQGALRGAPLGKAGQVGAWKSYVWNAAADNATEWGDDSGVAFSSIVVDTAAGVAEGVVDVGLLFGSYPENMYLAVAKYAAGPGGALLAQVPAGNGDGSLDGSEYLEFTPAAVSVAASDISPRVQLAPIHPNPAAGVVRMSLTLREPTDVDVSVQDVSGRRIATITRGTLASGLHELQWNPGAGSGRRQAPGVYFLVVRALGKTEVSRIVLLR